LYKSCKFFIILFCQPLPPGQKRVKEDWENIWIYGMGGSFLLGTIIAIYKPDTRQDHSKFDLMYFFLLYFCY
jgi:hypothetical protein